jgi:hypothetical protein
MLKELHRLANVPGQQGLCPVKDITDKVKAKEAAKWVVDQKHEDPSKDLKSLCLSAKIRFGWSERQDPFRMKWMHRRLWKGARVAQYTRSVL